MISMDIFANFAYIVSAALFIFGLKMLGSPATARRGNMLSSLGMLIAVSAALLNLQIVTYEWIVGGMIAGGLIGALAARLVAMTSMPEMVALFKVGAVSGGGSVICVETTLLQLLASVTVTDHIAAQSPVAVDVV